jgi:hypothetical protein
MRDANDNTCWICLDVCEETDRKCGCTNGICHKQCLAIWQMRNCGKESADKCQLCRQTLPDWKDNITPKYETLKDELVTLKAQVGDTMILVDISGSISERDLEALFEATIQKLTTNAKKLNHVDFTVKDPFGNGKIEFHGFSASCAVVYCAILSMISRRKKKKAGLLSCFS